MDDQRIKDLLSLLYTVQVKIGLHCEVAVFELASAIEMLEQIIAEAASNAKTPSPLSP